MYKEIAITDIDNWAKEVYGEWSQKCIEYFDRLYMVDSSIVNPVKLYAGYTYRDINHQLRTPNAELLIDNSELIRQLRMLIVSAPRIPEDIVVYRWVMPHVLDDIISAENTPYCEKAFLSTTLDPFIVKRSDVLNENFKLLKINVKKDTYAAYVDLMQRRNEKELIFLDECYLRFTGEVEKNKDLHCKQYIVNLVDFRI